MKTGPRNSALLRWHRRIGLVAAALVVVLALSGVALNHTAALGLDRRNISAPWLMQWYGINSGGDLRGYEAGGHWLSQLDGEIFFDGRMLAQAFDGFIGAVQVDNTIAAARAREILLLDGAGALIERITALPVPIARIGVAADGRMAIAADGMIFTSDTALLEWKKSGPDGVAWATSAPVPEKIREQIIQAHRGAGLSLERILLDVHSGRILGRYGPWLMDSAALLLLGLAASGVFGWLRNRNGNGANDAC